MKELNRWYKLEYSRDGSECILDIEKLGTRQEAYSLACKLLEDYTVNNPIIVLVSDDREHWEEDNQISRVRYE